MNLNKWYLAGPLFTLGERNFNNRLEHMLVGVGLEIWLPQANEPRELTAKKIFEKDVEGLEWADGVIAIYDGADPDSGTSWEAGYAYKSGKPIIAVRTDFRVAQDGGLAPYNLMLTESAARRLDASSLRTKSVGDLGLQIMLQIQALRKEVGYEENRPNLGF